MGNENSKLSKNQKENYPYMHRHSAETPIQAHQQGSSDHCLTPSNSKTTIEILDWCSSGNYRDSFALTALHAQRLHSNDRGETPYSTSCGNIPVSDERSATPACLMQPTREFTPYYAVARDSKHMESEAVKDNLTEIKEIPNYKSGEPNGHTDVTFPKPPPRIYRYSQLQDPNDIPADLMVESPSGKMITVEEFREHPNRPKCIRERQESIMRSMSRVNLGGQIDEEDSNVNSEEDVDVIKPIANGKGLKKKNGKRDLHATSDVQGITHAKDGAFDKAQHTEDKDGGFKQADAQQLKPALRPKHSSLLSGELSGIKKKVDFGGVPYGNDAACKYIPQANGAKQGDNYKENGTNNTCCNIFCGWDSPLVDGE